VQYYYEDNEKFYSSQKKAIAAMEARGVIVFDV
jgi:hypothetical protein